MLPILFFNIMIAISIYPLLLYLNEPFNAVECLYDPTLSQSKLFLSSIQQVVIIILPMI